MSTRRSRAAASCGRPARWSSASASPPSPAARALAQAVGAGPYPDPDFLAARHLDRDPSRQHRHVLRRQDGRRPRHGHGVPADDVRRARHRLRQDESRHGYHRHHSRSGRLGRLRRRRARRLADAQSRRRSPARVARSRVANIFAPPSPSSRCRTATISAKSDPSKSVTYAELVGGKRFDVALTGRNVDATTGTAAVKPVKELRVVGQSVPRYDIPGKVDGVVDVGRRHESARHAARA